MYPIVRDEIRHVAKSVCEDLYTDNLGYWQTGNEVEFMTDNFKWCVPVPTLLNTTTTQRINLTVDGFRQTHRRLGI